MSDLTEQASDTPIIDSCVKSADRYGDSDVVPVRVARELERGTNRLRAEVVQLRQWKESALSIMPDWQELGRLLNCTLGEDVPLLLLPRIRELRAEVERLRTENIVVKKANELLRNQVDKLNAILGTNQTIFDGATKTISDLKADIQAARKAMSDTLPLLDALENVAGIIRFGSEGIQQVRAALNAELEKK